ncbi:MAG: hypothetical protein HRF43_05095 [Phycisphaerae bacterium]|jgi:hypothetical protein
MVVTFAGHASAADPPLVVYANGSLPAGWQDWSWSTSRSFSNTNPRYGTSGSSIRVQHTSGWGGLYLRSTQSLNPADFVALQFQIHGGTTGGHKLQLLVYDAAGGAAPAITLPLTTANAWTSVEVPVSSFGVSGIIGLAWQDATGAAQPDYYLDEIQLTRAEVIPQPITLSVNAAAGQYPISPLIYGLNFADANLANELDLPVNRWGGNATTRYNWQTDVSNRASDWYFENLLESNPNPALLPNGSAADRFVERNLSTGAETIMTVPLIGWTPKPPRVEACGFSVAKYGPQQQTDPWRPDCGNGILPDGTKITWNDPLDTSVPIGPSFVADWVTHLVGRYGTAAQGGVRFYNLDNEPMLWNSTHRDVHPAGTSYDELRERTYQYAAAIKAADPTAATLGPVLWGWTAYFYSAADADVPQSDWWNYRPDRMAHGDRPFIEWYLEQMKLYEQTHGVRILDYLDLHYYPQSGVALTGAGDAETQARRLRSTRSLWDPTYVDESWIAQPVRLIPRMRDWVNTYYPGTKLAITEYNFGADDHINGALALADVLGIFGRERLDLATLWDPPSSSQPAAFALRMYRNYDGAGGRFGGTSIQAASTDQSRVSIYAARREDGRLTLMLINKSTAPQAPTLTLAGFNPGSTAVYRYSSADLTRIVRQSDASFTNGSLELALPASSITLLVVPPGAFPPGDFDKDNDVDGVDVQHFAGCAAGAGQALTGNCADADLDGDLDADQSDFGILQRCLSGSGFPAFVACGQ